MVKLVTARESRLYGPWYHRHMYEFFSACAHLVASFMLAVGLEQQLYDRDDAMPALVLILISLAFLISVNLYDLFAHMAGIDYRISLMMFDLQLAFVEFAVPFVHILGSLVYFIGILLVFIQEVNGYSYELEMHAMNTLIAGPVLWILGAIQDTCQAYQTTDSQVQIMQKGVQIPFLMGGLLFFVGGVFNRLEITGTKHPSFKLVVERWVWLSIFGSLMFTIGGLMNVVKVLWLQGTKDEFRLEKLRGGAQEILNREREGRVPLILEENRRPRYEAARPPRRAPNPYKDAYVGHHGAGVLR